MSCKSYFIFLLILLNLGCCGLSYAQDSIAPAPESAWTDEQWQQAKEGIEYTKPEEKEKKKEKPKEKKNTPQKKSSDFKVSDWLSGIFGSGIARILIITFIAVLLIFTIYYLIRRSGNAASVKIKDEENITLENLEDHLEETDLERFLRLSLEAADYKSAVRVLYLMSIQKLHHAGSIKWKKDKTNRDYLMELRRTSYYDPFSNVTLVYEIVWYGDKEVEATTFNHIKHVFDGFIQSINLAEKAN